MTEPAQQWRKKPVVIEAMQFNGEIGTIGDWLWASTWRYEFSHLNPETSKPYFRIKTLESGQGWHEVEVGDWIIKGVKGEFYPCKPDIFAATYEPVAPAAPSQTRQSAEEFFKTYFGRLWGCNPDNISEHACGLTRTAACGFAEAYAASLQAPSPNRKDGKIMARKRCECEGIGCDTCRPPRVWGWDERDYKLWSELQQLPSFCLIAPNDHGVSLKQVVEVMEAHAIDRRNRALACPGSPASKGGLGPNDNL
jgi:hypothetical protein